MRERERERDRKRTNQKRREEIVPLGKIQIVIYRLKKKDTERKKKNVSNVREIEREGQTERQTDRQTDSQRCRRTGKRER